MPPGSADGRSTPDDEVSYREIATVVLCTAVSAAAGAAFFAVLLHDAKALWVPAYLAVLLVPALVMLVHNSVLSTTTWLFGAWYSLATCIAFSTPLVIVVMPGESLLGPVFFSLAAPTILVGLPAAVLARVATEVVPARRRTRSPRP